MKRDTVPTVTEHQAVDYAHLPGEEQNPLMESTAHVDWGLVLLNSVRHALAGTDHLVTGNVAFAPADGAPHTAPDLMVIPGAAGQTFGRYEPGDTDPVPLVCVEILSPSNTMADIRRRCLRLLRLGVAEVYVLDPRRESIMRVERDGETLTERSAVGVPSPGLGITFALADGHLAVCCLAGRMVRPGDDPFGWLVDEMTRADKAEHRADVEAERADTQRARADLEAAQVLLERQRATEYGDRVAALEAELAALRGRIDG